MAHDDALLAGLTVQKHRKIRTDLLVTRGLQFFRSATNNHPIAILHRPAKQLIANSTADEIDFHDRELYAVVTVTYASGRC